MRYTAILVCVAIGCGSRNEPKEEPPVINFAPPDAPPAAKELPQLKSLSILLDWCIETTEPARDVAKDGNKVAYSAALAKSESKLKSIVGHPVTWPGEVSKVEQNGITVQNNLTKRENKNLFYLRYGSSYDQILVGPNKIPVGKALRPSLVSFAGDAANKLKKGEVINLTASIQQILYVPSPESFTNTDDEVSYSFFIILSNPMLKN